LERHSKIEKTRCLVEGVPFHVGKHSIVPLISVQPLPSDLPFPVYPLGQRQVKPFVMSTQVAIATQVLDPLHEARTVGTGVGNGVGTGVGGKVGIGVGLGVGSGVEGFLVGNGPPSNPTPGVLVAEKPHAHGSSKSPRR
jgi:hypothetical protein